MADQDASRAAMMAGEPAEQRTRRVVGKVARKVMGLRTQPLQADLRRMLLQENLWKFLGSQTIDALCVCLQDSLAAPPPAAAAPGAAPPPGAPGASRKRTCSAPSSNVSETEAAGPARKRRRPSPLQPARSPAHASS